MEPQESLYDPLELNLAGLTNQLLAHISPSPLKRQLQDSLHSLSTGCTPLLDILSDLLSDPAYTLIIARLYRPILLDLAARWVDGLESEARREEREKQLEALGVLIEVHIELYPILYRFLTSPTFKHGPLNILLTHPTLITRERLHRLLLSTFRILNINRELPNLLFWDLTPLSRIIWHGHTDVPVNASAPADGLLPTETVDNGARLLAIRCYAYQSGMGEAEREKLEKEVLGEIYGPECRLEYGKTVASENGIPEVRKRDVDGWILPVLEVQRIREERVSIGNSSAEELYYKYQDGETRHSMARHELSPHIADIHGILHLRSVPLNDAHKLGESALIETPTSVRGLQELALHLSLRVPTLLTSPPSSGKSLLISHLYSLIHPVSASNPPPSNPIITIHLSDTSLDARSLLGAYTSSTRAPGQFEFRDGILIRAMKEGRWVVLEEVDKASSEVLGMVVKPLAESMRKDGDGWVGQRASLDQLGRGRVVAHDDFRLFATRSVAEGRIQDPTFLGSNKWCEVRVGRPQRNEVELIIGEKFSKLGREVVRSVVSLWEEVKAIPNLGANATEIGLRELERFCRRLERVLPASATSHSTHTGGDGMDVDMDPEVAASPLGNTFTNPTIQEEIYLSAREVFFPFYLPSRSSLSPPATSSSQQAYYKSIADLVAQHLRLGDERSNWVLASKVPEFDVDKDLSASGGGRVRGVRIGRTYLTAYPARRSLSSHAAEKRPFALHKPALTLLTRLATSVTLSEPVLLTGETGTGKTSVITYLASLLSIPLISLNLSHQTETSDLIGGMKPVDVRVRAAEVQESWRTLFKVSFSQGKNEKFVGEVEDGVRLGKWKRVAGLWRESARRGIDRCRDRQRKREEPGSQEAPRKRRKVEGEGVQGKDKVTEQDWEEFVREVDEFDVQHIQGKGKFAFAFVEGPLVRALRNGDWILLDEINLASPETLECISSLLQSPTSSITLTEQTSSLTPVPRHPNFRLFACMNPATDVGKKDLSPTIRSRFTEIYVPSPDADKETLVSIIEGYLGPYAVGDRGAIMDVAEFYLAVKGLEGKRELADGGSNKRPHFSMRTLARALTFVQDTVGSGSSGFGFPLRRAIWEGCLMAFTMVLERERDSTEKVVKLAQKWLLNGVKNPRSLLSKEPPVPAGRRREEFVKLGPFYLEKGPLYEGKDGEEGAVEEYILTPSVERKLIDLSRIVLTRRVPVLIEGPTSAGKTSSVEYLARRTGHRFIRINNHEHTDIQEYIGSYVSDPITGKLVFKDGLLVRALRNGDWIVLDELNLAPTDVLEALNRLLDDNRELVIPETHEIVKPHPHFMLFATQNPPGLYAGRKVLSRAFRNRFLEVYFEDVPQHELETILCQRCRIAPTYGKKIVAVFHELQKRRQSSRVFESKQGFATLRDLFRWAGRDAVGYQELAENGYMLIAERARRDDDKTAVKEVIESVMHVKIDEKAMYKIHNNPSLDAAAYLDCPLPSISDLVWTTAMQRLFTLVTRALKFNEPILLVGETGSGKTSVCQVFAEARGQKLHGFNCHQNTETADLIGGLRPVRNRATREADLLQEAGTILPAVGLADAPMSIEDLTHVIDGLLKNRARLPQDHLDKILELQSKAIRLQSIFEWHDGPLVEAMRSGDVFLLDEISLADDSVLERLNSVLEPERSIVLAEKGGADDLSHPAIRAAESFKLIATMNPGGDYGKKELSPALRNRFTEIWVPRVEDRHDLELIVGSLWNYPELQRFTPMVLDFTEWLCLRVGDHSIFSLRDILAWVSFTNAAHFPDDPKAIPAEELFHHAAHMVFLDGLGSLPQLSAYTAEGLRQVKEEALSKLTELVPVDHDSLFTVTPATNSSNSVRIGSFSIPMGSKKVLDHVFNLQAPTTKDNAMRVIRACQVSKPILLEGSPGVGKTSLITAIANIAGRELYRINLSDQTDLIDLFGSDLPIEGGTPGEFAWKDAEFLKALQDGHWVLLDEMNLAPQAVLEGLNAVLDHRGTVYIPELGRTFRRHPDFRIFAAQNPLNQGGGRKGLPKSFVNRFTKVYIEELTPNDLLLVCQLVFPELQEDFAKAMVLYNMRLQESIVIQRRFAKEGSPWEFNLRDIIRWGHLLRTSKSILHPVNHLRTVYLHRFRNLEDQKQAQRLFDEVFSVSSSSIPAPRFTISPSILHIGHHVTCRQNFVPASSPKRFLKMQLPVMESLGYCLSQSWLSILTGHRNSGKTDVVRALAYFTGHPLRELSINSATDTMDLLGSFEQVDVEGRGLTLVEEALWILEDYSRRTNGTQRSEPAINVLRHARQASSTRIQALKMAVDVLEDGRPALPAVSILLGKIRSFLTSPNSAGHFEWVDGPLVQAIRFGYWLLMDGANLCNPSVLDRLNSLCEQGGVLTLSERGYVDGQIQVLEPHPNFRLFMTVDPQHGELSRAMRNRGIEISVLAAPQHDDNYILLDSRKLPPVPHGYHDKTAAIGFEAQRRAVNSRKLSGSPKSSTGMTLCQDSALSSLLDYAPAIVLQLGDTNAGTDAPFFFLGRTMFQDSLQPFIRFLSSLQVDQTLGILAFLSFLNESGMTSLRTKLREASVISMSVPSKLIPAQPFDFYLTSPACIVESNLPASKTAHRSLLQALDLATAFFLDREGKEKFSNLQNKERGIRIDKTRRIIAVVGSFLLEIEQMFREVLSLLESTGQALGVDFPLLLTFSEYGRELRRIVNHDSLDFSALQAICQLFNDAAEPGSKIPGSLRSQLQAFRDAVDLKEGIGLRDIWSRFYLDPRSASIAREYDASQKPRPFSELEAFRRRALDYLALSSLAVPVTPEDSSQLSLLKQDLDAMIPSLAQDLPAGETNPILLVAELGLFPNLLRSQVGVLEELKEIIRLNLHMGAPLSKTARLQHLAWEIEAGHSLPPTLARVQLDWLEASWKTTTVTSKAFTSGPSRLLQPTTLASTMDICDLTEKTLQQSTHVYRDLLEQARVVRLQARQPKSRIQHLNSLLDFSLAMLSDCFTERGSNSQLSEWVQDTVQALAMSGQANIGAVISHHLAPLKVDHSSREATIESLAKHWVHLGRLVAELFIPDAPIDPLAVERFAMQYRRGANGSLLLQKELHVQLELFTTGDDENGCTDYLDDKIEALIAKLTPTHSKQASDRDVSRLQSFWAEATQFRDQVISTIKLSELLDSLTSGEAASIPHEETFQQSMAGFTHRLDTVYGDLEDLVTPLKLAINFLRLGLNLGAYLALAHKDSATKTIVDTTNALVAYPTIASASELCTKTVLIGLPPFKRLLLTLSAINVERCVSSDSQTRIALAETTYEQALRLWHIDLAKQSEAEAAAGSLYRRKKTDYEDEGDAEREEREFLALFPSFEDVFAIDTTEDSNPSPSGSTTQISAADAEALVAHHHQLVHDRETPETSITRFTELRTSALPALLSSSIASLPDHLDQASIALQFSTLQKKVQSLRTNTSQAGVSYDFYQDPNVPEIQKACGIVSTLRLRLSSIIDEWPEQMVLHQLREKCDAILQFRLQSPVAKVLSALEQLLMQTEDWEMYANRVNTIKPNQHELIQLIVTWRRLELTCWQGLLDSQARAYEKDVAPWWFRLYDATIKGPIDALVGNNHSPDSVSQYLQSLLPLLDDYVCTSSVGQFQARLQLLASFELYIRQLHSFKRDHGQRMLLMRVERILTFTRRSYEIFSPLVISHLAKQRLQLEKEIRDFIKLASWKDVNVQALKASAQKTHHQLYKIVRKFREALKQPVSSVFNSPSAEASDAIPLPLSVADKGAERLPATFPNSLPSETARNFSKDLPRTITRFGDLILSRIEPAIKSRTASLADDLAVNIIATADDLAATPISGDVGGDARRKQLKALLVRKRKAWSDLLKELKAAGFAARVKPEVLRQNADNLWLRDQPNMPSSSDEMLNNTKGENYLYRLHSVLPQLRAAMSDHHSDLSTRELQRGLMFVESVFSYGLDLRSSLARSLEGYHRLVRTTQRLCVLTGGQASSYHGKAIRGHVISVKDILARAVTILGEIQEGLEVYNALQPEVLVPSALIADVATLRASTTTYRDQVISMVGVFTDSSEPFLTIGERNLLAESVEHLASVSRKLSRFDHEYPHLNYLFVPAREWLDSQEFLPMTTPDSTAPVNPGSLEIFINVSLVTVQNMLKHCPPAGGTNDGESDDEQYLFKGLRLARDITQSLNIEVISSSLDDALPFILSDPSTATGKVLAIKPFLDIYLSLAKTQLSSHKDWTTALLKLDFILVSIMRRLAKEGFCQPPDGEEQGDGGVGGEAAGGLGLGEGSGTDNVSKEIEDESQVEGLKGDDGDKQDKNESDRDDKGTIEMSEDIGGDLEDVSDAEEDEEGDSDDESEADPEERIEALDPKDPDAVDEKLWGDEKGPESNEKDDEKMDEDRSKDKEGDSEVVAKEGKQKESKQKQEPSKGKQETKDGDNEEEEEEEEEPGGDMEEDDEAPNASGAPKDDHIQDANTLDLPEDMDLGDDLKQDGDDMSDVEEDENDRTPVEEEEDMPKDSKEENKREENWIQEDQIPEDIPDSMDQDEGPEYSNQPKEAQNGQKDEESEDEEMDEDKNEAIARPDLTKGDGGTALEEEKNPETGDSATTGQAGGTQATSNQQNVSADTQSLEQQNESQPVGQQSQNTETSDSQTAGPATSGVQEGQAPSQPDTSITTNPLRSLGDALNEVRQRFDEILSSEKRDVPKEQVGDVPNQSQLEYLQPEDADHHMQALGPAGQEQAAKLNDLRLVDEEEQQGEAAPMDIDMPMGEENLQQSSAQERFQHEDLPSSERRDDVEGAIPQSSRPAANQPSLTSTSDALTRKIDSDALEEMEEAAEASLREWQSQGFPEAGGGKIWRTYESLTHDLAYALCEQLRLILEPTLATRLKGDYRTGKRLNMKKIISYIASDYTKDKIWLRRTRPSQREYQVLISIDDSRSMAESHSIHLAFETLALVSKALSRLEAGDIAIARFGEGVDILHGFDEGPFTDQAGTKVMNAFHFNQKATNVLSLVETSLKVLEKARERRATNSATAGDLWQLQFIISDGMCQDHDKLRTVLRKAEEQRVMIVFVILDSLHSTAGVVPSAANPNQNGPAQGSILTMDKAEFKNVDGRMELQLQKYLDSFPFEYYVVLRNVEALPEVLGSTLKQFFERISEE